MKIVWIQRYPSDAPRPVALDDARADEYLRQKQDDYRYTTGRAWIEDVTQEKPSVQKRSSGDHKRKENSNG